MTLAQARAYVLFRLGVTSAETLLVAQVNAQLDEEYQTLVADYRLVTTSTTLTVSFGDPLVDLPDDLLEILKINRGLYTLEPIEWTQFANHSAGADPASGPSEYVLDGTGRIRVWPTPSADDEGVWTCWYAGSAPAWDGESEEPTALPSFIHRLIPERVLEHIALGDEEPGHAAAAKARADILEGRLRRHMAKRIGAGSGVIQVAGLGY